VQLSVKHPKIDETNKKHQQLTAVVETSGHFQNRLAG
jgi:hypothetical protein